MTFSVQTETVRALASDLAQVDDALAGLAGVVSGFSGQLGAAKVESALNDFANDWSHGVSLVSTKASGLQQIAAGAANNYEESDAGIARAATGN